MASLQENAALIYGGQCSIDGWDVRLQESPMNGLPMALVTCKTCKLHFTVGPEWGTDPSLPQGYPAGFKQIAYSTAVEIAEHKLNPYFPGQEHRCTTKKKQ